jgi:hypothetical protein
VRIASFGGAATWLSAPGQRITKGWMRSPMALCLPRWRRQPSGTAASCRPGWSGQVGRNIAVHSIQVHPYARESAKLDRIRLQAEASLLAWRMASAYPAARAAEAHRRLEADGLRGGLVLTFG